MGAGLADLLDAGDGDAVERSGVADLPAHLGVEDGFVGESSDDNFGGDTDDIPDFAAK